MNLGAAPLMSKGLLNTRKGFKIWFSKNPSEFLPLLDQLRFIRTREKNKQADIFFVYSKNALSEKANDELNAFCSKYKIVPINFNAIDISKFHEYDQQMYKLAIK